MTTGTMRYDGPAVIVFGMVEVSVIAELRIEAEPHGDDGALYSWRGSISSEDRRLVTLIGRACDIRIPGAGTGRIHIPGGSYDMDQPPTTPVLAEVSGEGRAPWIEEGEES